MDDTIPSRRGDDLDPAIRRFVQEMSAGWAKYPDLATVPPPEARRIADQVRAPWRAGGPAMVAVVERMVSTPAGPVRVRCYDPGPPRVKPALIFMHGGGWTIFSLDTHDRVMREYAARAGVVVVGVDYALSPEAKYPVALQQVCGVTRFLAEHGGTLGIDARRLALGGDSAGANLSTAACLQLRDEGQGDLVSAMLLVYGAFTHRASAEARRLYGGPGYMLGADEMVVFWANYVRDERDFDDPLVCPARADLRGLPPALVLTGQCDVVAEQSVRFAGLLREAGVPTRLEVYEGASHSFLEAVSIAPVADRALDESAGWLRAALRENQAP